MHKLVKRISFLIAGTTFALLIIESSLRILALGASIHLTTYSEKFGFDHIPNAAAHYKSKEYNIPISINSQGQRDNEYQLQKAEKTYRIAIIGDSYTEGLQVPLDATAAKKLEAKLSQDAPNYEVINFSVSGFGIDQKYLYTKYKILNYKPDMIILFFSANDLDDLLRDGTEIYQDKIIFNSNIRQEGNTYPIKNILRKLHIFNFIYEKIPTRALQGSGQGIPLEYLLYQGIENEQISKYLNLSESLILESAYLAWDNNAAFLLVIGADRVQTNQQRTQAFIEQYNVDHFDGGFINQKISTFAAKNNISYLDLLPIFQKRYNNQELFFQFDGHWNSNGHELVAQALYEVISNKNKHEIN